MVVSHKKGAEHMKQHVKFTKIVTTLAALSLIVLAASAQDDAALHNSSYSYTSTMETSYTSSDNDTKGQQSIVFHQRTSSSGAGDMSTVSMNTSTGGCLQFMISNQQLKSDFLANADTSIDMTLKDRAIWNGTINADHHAKAATVRLDKTSTWNLTGDAYVTVLSNEDSTCKNITGNGHTLYYDAAAKENAWLRGQTIILNGSGHLTPVVVTTQTTHAPGK